MNRRLFLAIPAALAALFATRRVQAAQPAPPAEGKLLWYFVSDSTGKDIVALESVALSGGFTHVGAYPGCIQRWVTIQEVRDANPAFDQRLRESGIQFGRNEMIPLIKRHSRHNFLFV